MFCAYIEKLFVGHPALTGPLIAAEFETFFNLTTETRPLVEPLISAFHKALGDLYDMDRYVKWETAEHRAPFVIRYSDPSPDAESGTIARKIVLQDVDIQANVESFFTTGHQGPNASSHERDY